MFEELNAHRKAVQENIRKAFEIGFTGNEYLEKAYQVGDEATDKHGVTYYVHALNAAGKPLWRKKKDSGAKANNSSSTGRGNNSVKSSSSEQAVDAGSITLKITNNGSGVVKLSDSVNAKWQDVKDEDFGGRIIGIKIDGKLGAKTFPYSFDSMKRKKYNLYTFEEAKAEAEKYLNNEKLKLTQQAVTTADKPDTLKDAHKTQKPGQQQTKMKVDDTTIDQTEYDKAYKIATSATETEEHLKSSLAKIEENIKETKDALADASNVTAGKLQKMLTASVSKKKAIEDALKKSLKS